MPCEMERCLLPFHEKRVLPLNEEPSWGSPPKDPHRLMHNRARGLLVVSLRSQEQVMWGRGSECSCFARYVSPRHVMGTTVMGAVVIGCDLPSEQVAAVYTAYQSGSPCIHAMTVGLSIWHVTC
jgi:hypothetical protein